MRLLHRSLLRLSLALLPVIALWSAVFFLVVRHAVRESIDDGLEDQMELILHRMEQDSSLEHVRDLGLHGFALEPASGKVKKRFSDTLLYVPAEREVEHVRLMTKGVEQGGRLFRMQVYASTVEEDDLLEQLLWALLGLYAVVVLTLIAVHRAVLGRMWRPFHGILAAMKEFRLGRDNGLREVPTSITEFRELKQAADTLVRHAAEAYVQQRAFTGNAAHELQTPLAVAVNRLELIGEGSMTEEERMIAIGEVIASLERLVRLNRALLLLARIENHQFEHSESISLRALVGEVVEEFADLAEHRQVQLSLRVDGDLHWTMDPALARTLITNLVKNAIVHNMPNGWVAVEVMPQGIRVANAAAGKALDAERIFLRFHKETTADAGTGLGLAIAKAIADLYVLRIAYRFSEGHVLEVTEGDVR